MKALIFRGKALQFSCRVEFNVRSHPPLDGILRSRNLSSSYEFHVESINDIVNLVSLHFLGLGQHFCSTSCGDDMIVRWDLTGEKLREMEHLSFEVLHQSECHAPLELSLATSLIIENLHLSAHCVLAQAIPSNGGQGSKKCE